MPLPMERTATPGIFKRGRRYVVVVRDARGRQIKRSAESLASARRLRAELTADIARGEFVPEARIGFADYAREWRQTFQGRTPGGIRPRTLRNYHRIIEQHAIPFFGNRPLDEIGLPDIKRYAAKVAERGLTVNTVRLHVGPVRVLFATAVEDGILRANPAANFRNVYGRRSRAADRPRALSDDELAALLAEIPEEYERFARFLAESGLRVGEAIELRWSDIDLDAGLASVTRRFYLDHVDSPKSRNGIRTIPLGDAMRRELAELHESERAADGDLVFRSPLGARIDLHNWRRRVYKPAAKRAGVEWATIHMLRHTCASRLFRAGWSAKHVQQMLGHHSPAFTLSTYVHLMPGEIEALPLPEVH